jgi:hypothetical protein
MSSREKHPIGKLIVVQKWRESMPLETQEHGQRLVGIATAREIHGDVEEQRSQIGERPLGVGGHVVK